MMTDQAATKEAEKDEALEGKEFSFPYTSIFNAGGLLSELGNSEVTVEAQETQDQQVLTTIVPNILPEPLRHSKQINEETKVSFTLDLPGIVRDLPPPNEGVVTIDHILEQLFNSLRPRDLLTCRLVSHRWRIFAQIPLQNHLQFKFVDQILIPPISKKKLQTKTKPKTKSKSPSNSAQVDNPIQSPKTLTEFNEFLEQSLNISHHLPQLFTFPCSKFAFHETLLSDPELQKFLNLHGLHIDELTLLFNPPRDFYQYQSQPPEGTSNKPTHPHERDLMIQIKTLLLQQTPNISVLKVSLYSIIDWQNKNRLDNNYYNGRVYTPWLRTIDPEFQQIHSEDLSVVNSQLKTLQILGVLSAKVFEVICTLCPNLEEITFDSNSFESLLIPINRINYLKTLYFNLNDRYYCNFKKYEDLVDAIDLSKQNLQLRTLSMHMREAIHRLNFPNNPVRDKRVVNVLNKILESNWKSLENIKWDGVIFLNGIKWPILPNVTQLVLCNPVNLNQRGDHTLFAEGFGECFPKLRCLKLMREVKREKSVSIDEFMTWLNITEPLAGVQSVVVKGFAIKCESVEKSECCGCGNFSRKKCMLQFLIKLFPYARVRMEYISCDIVTLL